MCFRVRRTVSNDWTIVLDREIPTTEGHADYRVQENVGGKNVGVEKSGQRDPASWFLFIRQCNADVVSPGFDGDMWIGFNFASAHNRGWMIGEVIP
jgi:hypothetical protein